MTQQDQPIPIRTRSAVREVRVSLLIKTHALPALDYLVPEDLQDEVSPGAAVIAPLSGYSRLGVVVETNAENSQGQEYIRGVLNELSVAPEVTEVCRRLADSYAIPLPAVLRAAMPQGLVTDRYRIAKPEAGWPWRSGSVVSRATLKRFLDRKELQDAESSGNIEFFARPPEEKVVEWASLRSGSEPDLSRAPRQRQIFEFLSQEGGEHPVAELLAETGNSRSTLRELVRRRAVELEKRPEPLPIFSTGAGENGFDPRHSDSGDHNREAGRVVDRGGAWFWRLPKSEQKAAVSAAAAAALEGGEKALVLVPEIEGVDEMVKHLSRVLPEGYTVAPYHSGLAHKRSGIHRSARNGEIDVLVGTRAAALVPMRDVGIICVVDEPNEAHRAELGYEGLPVHARDIALERGAVEGSGVLLISPVPSLRVHAQESGIRGLPPRTSKRQPACRIVDMRGSGTSLSLPFVEAIRKNLADGKRVVVAANRLGYAATIGCNNCGKVWMCPNCSAPLALHKSLGVLVCGRCGHRERAPELCDVCGSDRISSTGFAIERLRQELSRRLGTEIGTITADHRENEDANLVVATSKFVVDSDWDVIAVADVDALLMGGGMGTVERAFRLIYEMTESARELIVVQTRNPDHYALQYALQRDYPSFAKTELKKLQDTGYPPYGHLASLTLEGDEETVRYTVESGLRPFLEPKVNMSKASPLPSGDGRSLWRVLLRSKEKEAVSRFATFAVRRIAKNYSKSNLRPRVEIDPQEV